MTQQTTAHKTVITLKEHTKKDLKLKFRNVHALIKKNRPISDITWFNQLYRAKGLDHRKTYDNMSEAWMAVQMTVLLNRKLYLLETMFREKLSQDLCALVNPNQSALKICLPL